MFTGFYTIRHIGNFKNQSHIRFAPVTLIYGLNGCGKSTLTDIFRSYARNDPQLIKNRKRIQSSSEPLVEMAFIENAARRENVFVFKNQWNQKAPAYQIEIFDSRFVDENVFASTGLQRANKVNLSGFVLGEENVRLGKAVELLERQKRENMKQIRAITDHVNRHIGNISIDDLLILPKPDNKESIEASLVRLQESQKRLTVLADHADKIRQFEEPVLLNCRVGFYPTNSADTAISDRIREIKDLLAQSFDTISQEALLKLKLHTDKNFRHRDGGERGWIEKGLLYIRSPDSEDVCCPFCGQGLQPVQDLLNAYQSFLGNAYKKYSANLHENLRANRISLQNTASHLEELRNDVQQNFNRLSRFKEYADSGYAAKLETADHLTAKMLHCIRSLKDLLAAILPPLSELIDKKLGAPFEPVITENLNTQDISSASDEFAGVTENYNRILKDLLTMISELKQRANLAGQNEALDRISAELSKRERELKRFEFDREMMLILELTDETEHIKDEINLRYEELRQQHRDFTDQYFSYVEKIYNYIHPASGFGVKPFLDSKGYQPVYFFRLGLRNRMVPEKSFPYVLSDGDRRTLGFSVFLAKLKNKRESSGLNRHIVVLDDPVISLDTERVSRAVQFIQKLISECRQVIVLSHDSGFLQRLYEPLRDSGDVLMLKLEKERDQSILSEISELAAAEEPEPHTPIAPVSPRSPQPYHPQVQNREPLRKQEIPVQKAAPSRKQIICLANSRKYSGRCIAGKEIAGNQIGGWIRPVSDSETRELSVNDVIFQDGTCPNLLDIISVPLLSHDPNSCQTENYLADLSQYWSKDGEFELSNLPQLCDDADTLWINGYESYNGLNDRIPEDLADELVSSLLFIKPENVCIQVAEEAYEKRKVRAKFDFKGIRYCLTVTDPATESVYIQKDTGEYPVNQDVYFSVSIGEPYNGYCYKLVAAIIELRIEN